MSYKTVNRITTSDGLRPYHLNPVQKLHGGDHEQRVDFSHFLVAELRRNPRLLQRLMCTDESPFDESGVCNCKNEHRYTHDKPHATSEHSHQTRYTANIWCGILGNRLVSITERFEESTSG